MKIGILTFQFADNYGALLQAYALKHYLEIEKNAEVEIINYVNDKYKNAYSINPRYEKTIKGFIRKTIKLPFVFKQRYKFNEFRRVELEIKTKSLSKIDNNYDSIVVGSDQVWNMDITGDDLNYFLPNTKINKYAYAASSSNSFVPEEFEKEVINALKGFNELSTREQQLADLIAEKYGLQISCVVDPVFLLEKGKWEQLAKNNKTKNKHYILVYGLAKNEKIDEAAKKLSDRFSYPIYVIHPTLRKISKNGKLLNSVGPKEFVSLVQNADYVITNSFHAFSFSLIFNVPVLFELIEGTSNRMESLIDLFQLNVTTDRITGLKMINDDIWKKECAKKAIQESKCYIKRIK